MLKKIKDFFKIKKELDFVSNWIFKEINFIVKNNTGKIKHNLKEDWDEKSLKDILEIERKWIIYIETLLFLIWLYFEKNNFGDKYNKIILKKINNKIFDSIKKEYNNFNKLKLSKNQVNKKYNYYTNALLENNSYKECSNKLINNIITEEDYEKVSKNINLYLYIKIYVKNIFDSWNHMVENNIYNKLFFNKKKNEWKENI